jgi:hypothetical protein
MVGRWRGTQPAANVSMITMRDRCGSFIRCTSPSPSVLWQQSIRGRVLENTGSWRLGLDSTLMTRSGHASRIGLQWREIAGLARHARAYRVMPGGADVGISSIVAIITVPLFDEIDSSIFFGR